MASEQDWPPMYDRKAGRSSRGREDATPESVKITTPYQRGHGGTQGKSLSELIRAAWHSAGKRFKSASASRYNGTYSHRLRRAATGLQIENPSTPGVLRRCRRLSGSRPGTAR